MEWSAQPRTVLLHSFLYLELFAQSQMRKLSCADWHHAKMLRYLIPFFFPPAYSCLVQITSISQKPLSFLHKGNWPHPKRYWPMTPIFCNSQLNAVNCSELCRFSSWWLFIIPYSGRSPEITTFLGLVCDSFWICTVTVQQIKLEEELVNISTLILIF